MSLPLPTSRANTSTPGNTSASLPTRPVTASQGLDTGDTSDAPLNRPLNPVEALDDGAYVNATFVNSLSSDDRLRLAARALSGEVYGAGDDDVFSLIEAANSLDSQGDGVVAEQPTSVFAVDTDDGGWQEVEMERQRLYDEEVMRAENARSIAVEEARRKRLEERYTGTAGWLWGSITGLLIAGAAVAFVAFAYISDGDESEGENLITSPSSDEAVDAGNSPAPHVSDVKIRLPGEGSDEAHEGSGGTLEGESSDTHGD